MFVAGVFRLLDVDRVSVLWLPRGLQERERAVIRVKQTSWDHYYQTIFAVIELPLNYGNILIHCGRCSVSFQVDGANLRMQTHLASKIMHHNFMAIQLWQKNSFIVLVPVVFA